MKYDINELKDIILDNVLIHKDQTYALYFKYHDVTFTDFVGTNEFTNFRLASVTKQFIAYGIINLVNDNLLSFDTTIKSIYPELPDYFNNITIQNLLNHTSGILDYEDYLENQYSDINQLQDEDIITFLKTTDHTYFDVGSKYQYSNTAYILLGLIIEKISKTPIEIYMQDNVFLKASMTDTKVNHQGKTIINNRAYGHIIEDGQIIEKDQYWCSATIGDGGIYSNVSDLLHWIRYIRFDKFTKLQDNMYKSNILADGTDTCYGMGMRILKYNDALMYTHSGWTIGTNTIVMFSNDLDFELIFLTNVGPTETDTIRENVKKIFEEENK